MNPTDPSSGPPAEKPAPVTVRLAAPLPDAARQRLTGHGKRLPAGPWWRKLRAFALGDGRRWCWRAGDDEPEPPVH